MEYLIGVDGGATKTLAVVGSNDGRILGAGLSGGSNHQTVGPAAAGASVWEAVNGALAGAGISLNQVARTVLGLSGADYPPDFALLEATANRLFPDSNVEIVNDSWVALRAGTRRHWGVVSVAGTGSNAAGINPSGDTAIVIGMNYELGTKGGAGDIVRDAFHFAFRAAQRTGPSTQLETEIPRFLGAADMASVREQAYTKGTDFFMQLARMAPLVFSLASEGDKVCQDILVAVGEAQGQAATGVIHTLGMSGMDVEVILAGSLWTADCPLMRDAFALALHRSAPVAIPRLPEFQPVAGAFLMALDHEGTAVTSSVYSFLEASMRETIDLLKESGRLQQQ